MCLRLPLTSTELAMSQLLAAKIVRKCSSRELSSETGSAFNLLLPLLFWLAFLLIWVIQHMQSSFAHAPWIKDLFIEEFLRGWVAIEQLCA